MYCLGYCNTRNEHRTSAEENRWSTKLKYLLCFIAFFFFPERVSGFFSREIWLRHEVTVSMSVNREQVKNDECQFQMAILIQGTAKPCEHLYFPPSYSVNTCIKHGDPI